MLPLNIFGADNLFIDVPCRKLIWTRNTWCMTKSIRSILNELIPKAHFLEVACDHERVRNFAEISTKVHTWCTFLQNYNIYMQNLSNWFRHKVFALLLIFLPLRYNLFFDLVEKTHFNDFLQNNSTKSMQFWKLWNFSATIL